MSQNSHNRKRAFADVVSIDAWHESFGDENLVVDLHADVVFGTARVGGESESPVRFRLSVRRAEVVVILPPTEPVSVDRTSVARDTPENRGQLTEVFEQDTQTSITGNVRSSLSKTGLGGSASGEAAAKASMTSSKKLEISATVDLMIVTQSKNPEGNYRWSLKPRAMKILEGRPWDPIREPRLKLVDQRKHRSDGIPPTVRVEVWCLREDLLIEDLEVKEDGLWEKITQKVGFKNRLAAAESYIRDRLTEEGLEVTNISDSFGQITLGSTIAEPT